MYICINSILPVFGINTVRKKFADGDATGSPTTPFSEEHVYSSVKWASISHNSRIATSSVVPFTVTFCSEIFTDEAGSEASSVRFLPEEALHVTLSGVGNPYATQVKRTICETTAVE